jgi:ADP-dependent NAD(P)H-hydrate dehydratase / NAD(P)H-hydrate epimerase
VLGTVPAAEITVTFGLAKQGLYLYPGRAYCGRIRVAEICLCPIPTADTTLKTYVTELADVASVLPVRAADAHKGDAGRVLVVAGSTGLTGAAAMSALAAARCGAGLVSLACPGELNAILEAKCTEVMTAPLMDHNCGFLRPRNTEAAAQLAAEADVVVLGPGLGSEATTREFVADLLALIACPVVLDADGLNAFAGRAELLADCPGELVITPHPGELSRLLDAPITKLQADRLQAAGICADLTGAVVVLKGAGTVTTAPGGETWINPTGNCGMASGGMGDILSGMIGALLAAGAKPLAAAYAAVWMHGRAADIAAEQIGPRGYLATDLLELLPQVYRELL